MMRWSYDRTVDALYVRLADSSAAIARQDVLGERAIVDVDESGEAVGIEFLEASSHPADLTELTARYSVDERQLDFIRTVASRCGFPAVFRSPSPVLVDH